MKYQMRMFAACVGVLSLLLFVGLALPTHAVQVVRTIAADTDDAEEVLAFPNDDVLGTVDVGSSDLELGREGPNAGDAQPQLVGVRFLDLDIPAGATITGATIRFTVDRNNKGALPLSVNITGELDPNPVTYAGDLFNISTRDMTSNSVDWAIPLWGDDDASREGESGPLQTTPDLSVIVQELVDQGGWASGNAMAFMFSPLPVPIVEVGGIREAESNASSTNTVLTIDYVPEPTSAVLTLLGLAPFVGAGRGRRRR